MNPRPTLTRRRFGTLLTGSLVAAGVTACGSGPSSTAAAPTTAAQAGTFPVTVPHIWGETTVESEPQRVVVLGVTDADAVLALGVTPVAIQPFFADYTSGVGPWAQDLVAGRDIQVLATGSEENVELIASLRPDLVIAVSSGFDQSIYDQLAQVAPTLVRPHGSRAYAVSREDATRSIAAVLGRADAADALLATANRAFTDASTANPRFSGATGTVVLPYSGMYGAYLPGDARGQVMAQLGFVLPAAVSALDDGSSFFVALSSERLDVLEGGVAVVLVDDATRAAVESDQVLQNLTLTKDGRLVVVDGALRGAMSYNTVLSAPYAVQQLSPLLATALGSTGSGS